MKETHMTAYVIVDIDVHDPVGYEEYKKLAPALSGIIWRQIYYAWRQDRNTRRRLVANAPGHLTIRKFRAGKEMVEFTRI